MRRATRSANVVCLPFERGRLFLRVANIACRYLDRIDLGLACQELFPVGTRVMGPPRKHGRTCARVRLTRASTALRCPRARLAHFFKYPKYEASFEGR